MHASIPIRPAAPPPRHIWLGPLRYWVCQLAGWGSVSLLSVIMIVAEQSSDIKSARSDMFFILTTCAAGLFGTHLLRAVALLRDWTRLSVKKMWLRWITCWLILSAILSVTSAALFATPSATDPPGLPLIASVMMNTTLLAVWIALYFLFHSHEALQRAEMEKSQLRAATVESQLAALQAQMNPHFLFNSLNTIRALVPHDAPKARAAITSLADILRSTLVEGKETLIPLRREMEITRSYLDMEKLRFEEKIKISEDVNTSSLTIPVPPLILLTLVENAIKHGLLDPDSGGHLAIQVLQTDSHLILGVTSPCASAHRPPRSITNSSLGIGLSNVRERLHLLFGPQATLTLARLDGTIQARIHLPLPTSIP